MPGSERKRELRRRRKRTKSYQRIQTRLEKAPPSERAAIAAKLRRMTPGANELIKRWGLEDSV